MLYYSTHCCKTLVTSCWWLCSHDLDSTVLFKYSTILFYLPFTTMSLLQAFPNYQALVYKSRKTIICNKNWIYVLTMLDIFLKQCSLYCASITSVMKYEDVLCRKLVSLRCQSQMNIHPADKSCSPWTCGTK